MSDPSDSYTQHAALFTRVYDLDDPSPYFSTLRPIGYRMPVALAGRWRQSMRRSVPCAARGIPRGCWISPADTESSERCCAMTSR